MRFPRKFSAVATPVKPPGEISFGVINKTTPKAYIKQPKVIKPKSFP